MGAPEFDAIRRPGTLTGRGGSASARLQWRMPVWVIPHNLRRSASGSVHRMPEKISEQIDGYYIATYACPVGHFGQQYLAHARVFPIRPRGFWDGEAIFKWVASAPCIDEEDAHAEAYAAATDFIRSRNTRLG
jgi:hypothetical protein